MEESGKEKGIDRKGMRLFRNEYRALASRIRSGLSSRRGNRIRLLDDLLRINVDDFSGKDKSVIGLEAGKTIERQFDLDSQISELKKRVKRRTVELGEAFKAKRRDNEDDLVRQLKSDLEELQLKERLKYILSRVNEEARQKLFESEDFVKLITSQNECDAAVLSMDIRRSTELMLHAKSPDVYAEFITTLVEKLSDAIMDSYGIFEKFTGDGVLAFFPDFYSGPDAMLLALKAACQCHELFWEHYAQNRDCFDLPIEQTGLGIGIDCGTVFLATINNELSIVRTPVVYACRFSASPGGSTCLTPRAYERALELRAGEISFREAAIDIKHEGIRTAYDLVADAASLNPAKPEWDILIRQFAVER